MLLEGVMRYVLPAYLHNMSSADTVFKSSVFTTYKTGPKVFSLHCIDLQQTYDDAFST